MQQALYTGCGRSRFTDVKHAVCSSIIIYELLYHFYTHTCKPKSRPFCPTALPVLPLSRALFLVNLTDTGPHTQLLKIPGILKGFPFVVPVALDQDGFKHSPKRGGFSQGQSAKSR